MILKIIASIALIYIIGVVFTAGRVCGNHIECSDSKFFFTIFFWPLTVPTNLKRFFKRMRAGYKEFLND